MKLASLKAFVAAVEAGSLRAAAERTGVSQPALTKSMHELERDVCAKLLTRTSRGVVPTSEGLVLYEHALRVNKELGLAQARIKAISGETHGEINVSAMPTAVVALLPQAIRTFSQAFPLVRLRLQEELYPASLSRLRSGELDVTVGGIPSVVPPGEFSVMPLLTSSMVIVTRKGSPWCKATSLRQLQPAPWIYTDAKRATGYAAELFSANALAAPPNGIMVNSTLSMLALLEKMDYVALLPLELAQHPLAQKYLQQIAVVEGMLNLTVGAIVSKSTMLSPIVRSFLTHLERSAQNSAQFNKGDM